MIGVNSRYQSLMKARMYIKVTVSTIIANAGRVLMVQERMGNRYGKWNIPGGRLNLGESLVAAARREVAEETGYACEILALQRIYNYLSEQGNHCIRYVFTGKADSPPAGSHDEEVLDVQWLPIEDVSNMRDAQLCSPTILRKILADFQHKPSFTLDILDEDVSNDKQEF